MGTKPQWTKSPWIISSSELICSANINTISADPWLSSFSSYTEFFEGWKLVNAFSRSELGEKKNNWENPNESRNHFFSLCVSNWVWSEWQKWCLVLLSSGCFRNTVVLALRKWDCPCAVLSQPVKYQAGLDLLRREGLKGLTLPCAHAQGACTVKSVLLKNFIRPNCGSAQPRQEVALGSLEVKRAWTTAIGQPLSHLCNPHWIQVKKNPLFLHPN